MAIELNMDALTTAGASIGVGQHQLAGYLGMPCTGPATLALIATAVTRLPVSLHAACRVTTLQME
jgi:hypothetical protein